MGLSVEVGYLADLIANDPEGVEYAAANLQRIDEALAEKGYDQFSEPTDGPVWSADMLGYSALQALRELAAMIWRGQPIPREFVLDGSQSQYSDELSKEFFEHLLSLIHI